VTRPLQPDMPPWDDPATRAEFARERRARRRALAGWSAAGLFAALARYDTCPFCGRSFAVPDDEDRQASRSWNHCYSCKVRIR
jgi:hypothetical protein